MIHAITLSCFHDFAFFWEKKGGAKSFFSKKNRGAKTFFQTKKGGEEFFSEEIRGGDFFRLKKGGRRLFQTIFPKIRKVPGKF